MATPQNLSQLMTLTTGGDLASNSRTQQILLTVTALLASLALAAIWGLAAGSSSASLAIANIYKVPMVILLSALTALPAGLVALRFAGGKLPARELIVSFATSIFGGTLVLATLAPLVAIYYHTSSKAGLPIALGSVFVALATAAVLFGRAVARRVAQYSGRAASLFAVAVLVVLFLASLLQFVGMASPIIGETGTRFDGGFDSVFHR